MTSSLWRVRVLFLWVDSTTRLRVVSDDPYYWLYYSDEERPPSYFQLELELPEVGRVLRFDSFSKIISGGIRFGWASGPKALIDAINVQVCPDVTNGLREDGEWGRTIDWFVKLATFVGGTIDGARPCGTVGIRRLRDLYAKRLECLQGQTRLFRQGIAGAPGGYRRMEQASIGVVLLVGSFSSDSME